MLPRRQFNPNQGGDRHPLRVVDFIVDYLVQHREASTTEMHRAYKVRMDELAKENGRKDPYRKATWNSFNVKVWDLVREGRLTYTGREEESDAAQFTTRDEATTRKLFRLAR